MLPPPLPVHLFLLISRGQRSGKMRDVVVAKLSPAGEYFAGEICARIAYTSGEGTREREGDIRVIAGNTDAARVSGAFPGARGFSVYNGHDPVSNRTIIRTSIARNSTCVVQSLSGLAAQRASGCFGRIDVFRRTLPPEIRKDTKIHAEDESISINQLWKM